MTGRKNNVEGQTTEGIVEKVVGEKSPLLGAQINNKTTLSELLGKLTLGQVAYVLAFLIAVFMAGLNVTRVESIRLLNGIHLVPPPTSVDEDKRALEIAQRDSEIERLENEIILLRSVNTYAAVATELSDKAGKIGMGVDYSGFDRCSEITITDSSKSPHILSLSNMAIILHSVKPPRFAVSNRPSKLPLMTFAAGGDYGSFIAAFNKYKGFCRTFESE